MKKIVIALLTLVIAISTTSCNNSKPFDDSDTEEFRMENTMKELVNENYTCITELFYYGNLPYGEVIIEDGEAIAEIESDKFKSLQDIETYLSKIYVSDEVERLIDNYLNNQPLYFEKNGGLYLYVEQSTSAGLPAPWDSFKIEIVNSSENECEFNAIVKYMYDTENEYEYSFKAIKENSWKLCSVVYKPNIK